MYAYDTQDMLIASGGTAGYCAIAASKDCKYDLAYIQAWLNHPYTEQLLCTMGSDFEGGYTARGTYLLKKIPFLELDFAKKEQKAAYDAVVSDTKKIYHLNERLQTKSDRRTKRSHRTGKGKTDQTDRSADSRNLSAKVSGGIMILKEDSTKQKLRGAYYTPERVAEKMVEFFRKILRFTPFWNQAAETVYL